MPRDELVEEIYRELCGLSCHNSGVIACAPEVLRHHLSTNLIYAIAAKAAEVARRDVIKS